MTTRAAPPAPVRADVHKGMLLTNLVPAGYFLAIAFWFPYAHPMVFGIFLAGGDFHLWQLGTCPYTVWGPAPVHAFDEHLAPSVDLFVTVAGEPVELVAETLLGALRQDYPGEVRIALLNDGLLAGKDNWRELEQLAQRMGVACITRTEPGGAKTGDINHALGVCDADLVAVLDADDVPEPYCLSRSATSPTPRSDSCSLRSTMPTPARTT